MGVPVPCAGHAGVAWTGVCGEGAHGGVRTVLVWRRGVRGRCGGLCDGRGSSRWRLLEPSRRSSRTGVAEACGALCAPPSAGHRSGHPGAGACARQLPRSQARWDFRPWLLKRRASGVQAYHDMSARGGYGPLRMQASWRGGAPGTETGVRGGQAEPGTIRRGARAPP